MVKSVTSRGRGFPDYTDMIHRVAISAYGKNQGYFWALYKFLGIYGQTQYYVDIPLPEGKKIYLHQVDISTSVGYLVDLIVRIISNTTEEYVVSDYGGVVFKPRVPIYLTSNDTLRIFFAHYAPSSVTAYVSLNLWGVME